jgi:hypothetical protein
MKLTEHQRLLLPYDPPLPAAVGGALPSIPQLWERAKVMFGRVISHIGSTADLSKRWRLTRTQKKEVLGWLEPVEKLARSCLLVRAFSFLLMTPEGRRLMRETPKMAMPEPAKPPARGNPFSTKIPMPGWHTIAQNQRAFAEQRKIEQQRAAEQVARDRHDPENWGGGFRVVGWRMPEPEDGQRAVPCGFQKQRLPWVEMVEPNPWLAHGSVEKKPQREKDEPALVLARRIEALGRVINNPAPAVMRLARFIAKLPKEALEGLREQYAFARPHWFQGRAFDIPHAAAHARRAATIFCIDSS